MGGGFQCSGDIDMRRWLIDANVCGVGIQRADRYPGGLVVASYPHLVAAEAENDPLVLVIKVQPELIAAGITVARLKVGGCEAIGGRSAFM